MIKGNSTSVASLVRNAESLSPDEYKRVMTEVDLIARKSAAETDEMMREIKNEFLLKACQS